MASNVRDPGHDDLWSAIRGLGMYRMTWCCTLRGTMRLQRRPGQEYPRNFIVVI